MATPPRGGVELFFGGLAGDFDEIGLLDAGCGFGELVGEFAVVGDQQQAFAQVVEAADGIEALVFLAKNCMTVGRPSGSLTVVTKPWAC